MKAEKDYNARDLVLTMLVETLENGQFSHLVLQKMLSVYRPEHRDKVFMERLFHGVLEQVLFLDYIISSYSSVKIKKMKPVIRNILRMSIYQMLFMDSVPERAAINEAVNLAKSRGFRGLAPFVNGLLRSFQRGGIKPGMPEHVRHSAPLWLYERMTKELGKTGADLYFDAAGKPKDFVYARLALHARSKEAIINQLEEEGCRVEETGIWPEAVKLYDPGDLDSLTAWKEGLFFIQDLSSMSVACTAAELTADSRIRQILDVCAAPGGKSLHLADRFPNASVLSRDLSEEKIHKIQENIERSGLTNIRTEVFDATVREEEQAETEDIVLADLPCSGLGVIGRKPEIRLRVQEEDLDALAKLQREILDAVWLRVRKGGLLLYSTCTVNRQENQDNAAWFEQNYPFEKIYERQWIPGQDDCDGFYLAAFRRLQQ